jgi:hypothetical protein
LLLILAVKLLIKIRCLVCRFGKFGTILEEGNTVINKPLLSGLIILALTGLDTLMAQEVEEFRSKTEDSVNGFYYIIKGDTIPREYIGLDEVVLLNKLSFNSKEDRRRYLILRRKTRKVYPYAKLAAERLTTMSERLATLERKGDRRRYTRRIQKYIEGEFSDQLKKLTHTEGQILVKLIH